jgi:hypothetical protein
MNVLELKGSLFEDGSFLLPHEEASKKHEKWL